MFNPQKNDVGDDVCNLQVSVDMGREMNLSSKASYNLFIFAFVLCSCGCSGVGGGGHP